MNSSTCSGSTHCCWSRPSGSTRSMVAFGLDGWRELWTKETFILRESSVATTPPEDDLFAGLREPQEAAIARAATGGQ